MMPLVRKSVFSGSFYPSDGGELSEFISRAVSAAEVDALTAKPAKAFVSPHAGYTYSGATAGYAYKALSLSSATKSVDTVVVIGPNHTGIGAPLAVSGDDWETPLGEVRNDSALSEAVVSASQYASMDGEAHAEEHSIEVQLPFIQSVLPGKRVCMVCMGDQSFEASQELAAAILKAAKSAGRRIVAIASSDMDHYEPAEIARRKDTVLIRRMESMDAEGFNSSVGETEDSACGYGPITVAMLVAATSGAKRGEVLKYSNSGDVTGDYSSVVAYASLMFK